MKTYLYTCKHCYKEFRPTRRGVQKFCSDSCRVSNHQCNKRLQQVVPDSLAGSKELKPKKKKGKKNRKEKKEGMSLTGIGDAAVGTAIVDTIKNIFTPEHNKPATKGDIIKLANHLTRYRRIESMEHNLWGHYPYLEMETGKVVHLDIKSGKFY